MRLKYICTILIIIRLSIVYAFVDPATWALGIGAGIGAVNFDFIKEHTYCQFRECCNNHSIPGNISELQRRLQNDLYGQHIVLNQVVPALEAHLSANKSRKPLLISFHGTPGTGKSYVADLIALSLYKNGLSSKYVHKYFGRADFPLPDKVDIYKDKIDHAVREAISNCPRSLFIFDEVDKMPAGIFESLTSLADYNLKLNGKGNSEAIFLFLSNTGGVHISDRLGELLAAGISRKDTKLNHFEQKLEMIAYNMEGGMKKTSLIEAHLIDHFIPFLPLEKKHVYKCIEAEFLRWGKQPESQDIETIIKETITYDRNFGLFATVGCKTIEKKVAVAVKSSQKT